MQSQVRFNRVLGKVPEKVPGSVGAKPTQVQQGFGEGLGGFGAAKPGSQQVLEKVPEKAPGGSGAESGQVQQDLWAFNSEKPSLGVWLRSMLQKNVLKNILRWYPQ